MGKGERGGEVREKEGRVGRGKEFGQVLYKALLCCQA
jgi:hypothetical protein